MATFQCVSVLCSKESAASLLVSEAKWCRQHDAFRKANPELPMVRPPPLRGVCTERSRDMLRLAWAFLHKRQEAGGAPAESHLVDTSQCISRRPWGPKVRSLTTSSQIFSYKAQRMLTADEHFLILGSAAGEPLLLSGRSVRPRKEKARQEKLWHCQTLQ